MANTKSAKKRIRQTAKRTERNRRYIAGARTYIKKTRQLVEDGNIEEAEAVAVQAYSTLDKAGRRNILHPRNAARRKGRLMALIAKAKKEAES